MPRRRKPPSPTWRAFLDNHARGLVSMDFFTVPTVFFHVLFVLVVLARDTSTHLRLRARSVSAGVAGD
jgi:hypothetical protein